MEESGAGLEAWWSGPVSAFVVATGFQPKEVTATRVTGWADLGPDHHTPHGVVHGGVYATLVETAASLGATAAVAERGQYAVGVHNATDFLRPHTAGRVTVTAEPIQQGRVQQLWEVRIEREQDGALLARGLLRLQNVHPR